MLIIINSKIVYLFDKKTLTVIHMDTMIDKQMYKNEEFSVIFQALCTISFTKLLNHDFGKFVIKFAKKATRYL